MTATLLANELSNLISEAKRKNSDLKTAAERSLSDLKALPTTSEQQLANDLSRRPAFIEPFLIACTTRNAKFAASGIVCLQRLVISKGLAKSRLQDALEAFNSCTDLGLDIQLKILQALPSLLQNYASDLEGDLLSGALQVCSALQAVKASTVSGVASATLQQLVSSVFEKVGVEDRHAARIATVAEVPGDVGPIALRPAAYDAYRLLRDLALAVEERTTKFVTFTALSPESSLELIWSCIDTNAELFADHDELTAIVGSNVFPIVLRALSERLSFPVTLRSIRILNLLLDSFLLRLPGECEVALGLCTQMLDPDAAPEWKRALVMEIFRDFFDDNSHIVDAYTAFDAREGGKPIVQDLMSAFVRLSSEKPSTIGLGSQSTMPTGPASQRDNGNDQATLEAAGGMVGVISSALGVNEVGIYGISSQWSQPRTACMEQLDKSESTTVPETYIYALVLECLNGLADCLARIVLPLTVHHEKSRSRSSGGSDEASKAAQSPRSQTFGSYAVPLNPLAANDAPFAARVQAVAGLVESCWPAVLATSSTFLNAALDDHYFRNLIKAYQRFAQVAGLLRLVTPRDALMTTLAKASVPPHVLNAATQEPVKTHSIESSRVFSNPLHLLSVDSLVSQTSSLASDRDKRTTAEAPKAMLMVRNLLCLRALLNLAIALGPTLESAFAIVVSALRHTDLILSTTTPQQVTRQGAQKGSTEAPTVVQAFSNEVAAVEAAASRLLESTADYPNNAFMNVLQTFCQFLHGKGGDVTPTSATSPSSPSSPQIRGRKFSGVPGLTTFAESQSHDYHFVIPKLGNLAELNVARFISEEPRASGWAVIIDELMAIAKTNRAPRDARRAATNVLVKLSGETIANVTASDTDQATASVQERALAVLLRLIEETHFEDDELTTTDLDVQARVLESLRAILERSGESLVAGWNRIIAIIVCGAFEYEGHISQVSQDEENAFDWSRISFELVSPQVGRAAFAATQLVCSDFLDALPLDVTPSLIELLYRFMCQSHDLNTALTTVTMAWNVSNFLFTSSSTKDIGDFIDQAKDFDDVEDEIKPLLCHSRSAQWFSLLLCLRNTTTRPSREVRNAAFQTTCNVFKSYGQDLLPQVWDVLLRCTLLHIARTDSMMYFQDGQDEERSSPSKTQLDIDTSRTIITGIADVLSENLGIIEQVAKLPGLWEIFLGMLERYLEIENHILNAAIYFALAKVLAGVDPVMAVWKGPIYRTVHLWLKRVPTHDDDSKQSNQDAFLAYAEAGEEIYRLTSETMSMSQTRTLIDNLYHCIESSDGPLHGGDVSNMSRLQARAMHLLQSIRTDQPNIPPCLITVAAKLAGLHHETPAIGSIITRPTFVAVASESISWLERIVQTSLADQDTCDADALLDAVQSLRRLVTTKYAFKTQHRSLPLWRRATSTALALALPILDRANYALIEPGTKASLWLEYSQIIRGIVTANAMHTVNDYEKLHADELFDIDSFKTLQQILIPRLGAAELPDSARLVYVGALFDASIIHMTEPGEILELSSTSAAPISLLLDGIATVRHGRTKTISPTPREEMAYVCLQQLIDLTNDSGTSASAEQRKLAQTALPYLILRLALPIRTYIADQPLRGRRPQPMSELEELIFCFDAIRKFANSRAPEPLPLRTDDRQYISTKHLYPLLVRAVATAGDGWSGSSEVLGPLQAVLASFVQVS